MNAIQYMKVNMKLIVAIIASPIPIPFTAVDRTVRKQQQHLILSMTKARLENERNKCYY